MSETIHEVYRITERRAEGEVGVTLYLDGELQAEPGQFVMVWLPGVEERPFTLMKSEPVAITVAAIGPFTRRLIALEAGDRLWIRGPYGHGFSLHGQRHLLAGGGSGTASLTMLAERAVARGDEVTAVVGARTAERLMLDWRLKELGCRVIRVTDDGSVGRTGTAVDVAEPILAGHQVDAVYACGPEPMLQALAAVTRAHDVPLWISVERVMKCGIGVCGNCYCGDQLVCRDGPVFARDEFLTLCPD